MPTEKPYSTAHLEVSTPQTDTRTLSRRALTTNEAFDPVIAPPSSSVYSIPSRKPSPTVTEYLHISDLLPDSEPDRPAHFTENNESGYEAPGPHYFSTADHLEKIRPEPKNSIGTSFNFDDIACEDEDDQLTNSHPYFNFNFTSEDDDDGDDSRASDIWRSTPPPLTHSPTSISDTSPPTPEFFRLWERQQRIIDNASFYYISNNPFLPEIPNPNCPPRRVYQSTRRQNYCDEYDRYRDAMRQLRMSESGMSGFCTWKEWLGRRVTLLEQNIQDVQEQIRAKGLERIKEWVLFPVLCEKEKEICADVSL